MARDEQPDTKPEQGAAAPEERRGVLRTLVTLGGVAYAGALAVPAARFLAAPAAEGGAGGERWVRVGRLAEVPPGAPRRLQVKGDERDAFTVTRDQTLGAVWVERRGDAVIAFSATCPHLGCAVDLRPDNEGFGCPCHASRFGLDGAAIAGPSPRALDPLAARVVDGWIEIDFRRYRQGITAREEVRA